MLNLVNTVSDDKAIYLKNYNGDLKTRQMSIGISYDNILTVLGYEEDALVWFSQTKLSDILLSRRIFESMRWGEFYRTVSLADIFVSVNLTVSDLSRMWHASIVNIETDAALFIGEPVTQTFIHSGAEFSSFVKKLPDSLNKEITKRWSDDDIITALERDLRVICTAVEPSDREKVKIIAKKWLELDYLKLSRRVTVRDLYHELSDKAIEFLKKEMVEKL